MLIGQKINKCHIINVINFSAAGMHRSEILFAAKA
jgi:hypothetical protein